MCYFSIVLVNLSLNDGTDVCAIQLQYLLSFYAPVAGHWILAGTVTLAGRDVGHWSSEAEGEYFAYIYLSIFM